jgi:HSP20 family molecular chaperone IbpA
MSDVQKPEPQKTFPRVRPATDIIEREDGFHIFLDMPGVKRDELVIDLNENELRVSGKAVHPAQVKTDTLSMEFGSGEYIRSFTLSDAVDREGIKAILTNGVLELHLPKVAKVQPKRIEIQAG